MMIVVLEYSTGKVYFIKTKKNLVLKPNKAQKLLKKKGFKIGNCDWMVVEENFSINFL